MDAVKNYETYIIESISKVDEFNKFYIFDVIPPKSKVVGNYDEDSYYELHIKTIDYPIYYNDFFSDHIHIEIIDDETLELYEGEYYEECYSNGPVKFEIFELKKFEKKQKVEYKTKFISLKDNYDNLFNKKLVGYGLQRSKVIKKYQEIYNDSKSSLNLFGLDEKNNPGPLLNYFYYLFHSNPISDSLNKYIDPYYKNGKQIKSWKQDYENLNTKFGNLEKIDETNYEIILNQIIQIFEEKYVKGLKYYGNIDISNHNRYFEYLMTKLKQTV